LIEELRVEIYNKVKEDVEKWLESAIDELRRSGLDEKTVKSIAKATAATEVARLHSTVMEEIARVRSEFEEKLAKLGIDPELVEKIVNEVSSKLLNEIDKRFMHVLDAMNEMGNMNKDVLDLVSEILRAEVETEETLSELRSMLSEERIEELIYKVLIRRGLIRRRKRKWVWIAVGLGVLSAIIAGFVINPAITAVIILIIIAVLLRW
jgi:hypothetical protein